VVTKYRKIPVEVEAIQYTGEQDKHKVREFVTSPIDERDPLQIESREGWLRVAPGDWIVKGFNGDCWVVSPEYFAAAYEAAPEHFGNVVIW
jgi:hypothetical protein